MHKRNIKILLFACLLTSCVNINNSISYNNSKNSNLLFFSDKISSIISSSSTKYLIPINTPIIHYGDGLLFWDKIAFAKSYDIYINDIFHCNVNNNYFQFDKIPFNSKINIKALSKNNEELSDSNFSNYINIENEIKYEINVLDNNEKSIIVNSKVTDLHFFSKESSITMTNYDITIEKRHTPLTIRFTNIKNIIGYDKIFFKYEGAISEMPLLIFDLNNVEYFHTGTSTKVGENGADAYAFFEEGGNASSGGNGQMIGRGNNILLKYSTNLLIKGGNGANGGNGGYSGGNNGGDGGKGGNGATTFSCYNSIYTFNELNNEYRIIFESGNGGLGGERGECGTSDLLNSAKKGSNGSTSSKYIGFLNNLNS